MKLFKNYRFLLISYFYYQTIIVLIFLIIYKYLTPLNESFHFVNLYLIYKIIFK